MFDHVDLRVTDLPRSRAFYDAALGAPTYSDAEIFEYGDFGILEGPNVARRLHIGFGVPDREAVDAWWERLTAVGYTSDGEPGPRPQYGPRYYGAFVLDPDGNSIEAMHHDSSVPSGMQHLWFRTRDLAAARRFYESVAPFAGIELKYDEAERFQYRFLDGVGSFSFVVGEPTENVHIAFAAPDRETVDRFYDAAISAGYRDNGAPGERPQYHPGYYGAFVLDPDGHNVEAVFHDRGLAPA
ncbi:MAG TPA: VOC family protein [Gaiellaceae bacterium]|nr:VOC family protein [Gaiellaceae bacterium]